MKHVIAGLVALCLGICGLILWFKTFGMVMRGLVPFLLLVGGLVALLSGYRRLTVASRDAVGDGLGHDVEDLDEDEDDLDEEEEEEIEREAEEILSRARGSAAMN